MTGRLRALGRWITDWRTGATLIASILVGLLAVIVIDSIQGKRAADLRTDRTITELEHRGERIDDLAAQLDVATSARERLAEEVRALRELLINGGMLEPRAAASPSPTTAPRPSPRASSSSAPAPRPTAPSSTPRPSPPASPSPSPSCTVRNPLNGTCLVPPDRKGR